MKVFYLFYIILCSIGFSFGSLCETRNLRHAFNVGYNVLVDNNWFFDSRHKSLINRRYEYRDLFEKKSFYLITTAFSFIFKDCDATNNTSSYCKFTSIVKNVLIVIGYVINDSKSGYEIKYVSYYYNNNIGELKLVENVDFPWDLNTTGELRSTFWTQTKIETCCLYESIVFIPMRNELLATGYDPSDNGKQYMFSRKLDKYAFWSRVWKFETHKGFRGMFHIDNRVFALDDSNGIYEINWFENNTIYFKRVSNAKNFFNCYNDSILMHTSKTPLISTTKTAVKHTTITAYQTTSELNPNSIETRSPDKKSKKLFWIIIITVIILTVALIVAFIVLFIYWRINKSKIENRLKLKKRAENIDNIEDNK